MAPLRLEPCNRCCSDLGGLQENETVICGHCGFTEALEVWQLRGWRSLEKYPPVFGGTIFVYGQTIGRKEANWNAIDRACDNPGATHWLRTPDPRKQIGMD